MSMGRPPPGGQSRSVSSVLEYCNHRQPAQGPFMRFAPETSVLLLIDFQARLMPAICDADIAVANARRLAEAARLLGVPIRATEQNPAGLGRNVGQLAPFAERTLTKRYFDATREAEWAGFIPEGRPHIVVAGCETHVCVMQTVLGMLEKGLQVRLVRDAVGSRTPDRKSTRLNSSHVKIS